MGSYDRVIEAMAVIRGTSKGTSRQVVYNKLGELFPGMQMTLANKAIKKHVEDGNLKHGSTKARFKLTDQGKEYSKEYFKKKEGKDKKKKPKTPTKSKKSKRSSKKRTPSKKRTGKKASI